MKAFDIDIDSLKESKNITDERELLKLRLVAELLKITSKMDTATILKKTGLHKSDYSRLRSMSVERFTIDKIIGLLSTLGFTTDVIVSQKKQAS